MSGERTSSTTGPVCRAHSAPELCRQPSWKAWRMCCRCGWSWCWERYRLVSFYSYHPKTSTDKIKKA